MRAFAVKLVSMLVLVLWWPLSARAECQRPEATALTSETSKLEGQVSVTVASLAGGSLEASGDKARAWETQLPSQSAVDNQWYLFYVCQEYEAHRITERVSANSECVDGAKVTLQSLSSDAVLMQWSGGSASAQGMLRLAE
jgi:hypothetical protein